MRGSGIPIDVLRAIQKIKKELKEL